MHVVAYNEERVYDKDTDPLIIHPITVFLNIAGLFPNVLRSPMIKLQNILAPNNMSIDLDSLYCSSAKDMSCGNENRDFENDT